MSLVRVHGSLSAGAVSGAAGAVCFPAFSPGAPLASAGSAKASSALRFCKYAFALPSPMVSRRYRQFSWTFPLAAVLSMVSKHMPHVRSCLGRRVLPGMIESSKLKLLGSGAGDAAGAVDAVSPSGGVIVGATGMTA